MSSIKEIYNDSIPTIMSSLKLENKMEVPKIVKVVLNMGLGSISDGGKDTKIIDEACNELTLIAGQKAVITKAKKSEAGFKLREGYPIGSRVTLRGERMYQFISKLVNLALPRVRDFRGISNKAFDKSGNYNLGIQDHLVFPEIDPTMSTKVKGLNITIVTTAINDEQSKLLLEKLGFPFRR
jgi:large subunit ribosomal protein L5|tara:strand:+ start:27160 stop:27705 length:546 start_codon:yes stop_codon:yes gene_type:complete